MTKKPAPVVDDFAMDRAPPSVRALGMDTSILQPTPPRIVLTPNMKREFKAAKRALHRQLADRLMVEDQKQARPRHVHPRSKRQEP